MNAAINSLILIPKIRDMLIKQWNNVTSDVKKQLPFSKFFNDDSNLKDLLYSLVNILIIEKEKALPSDKNIIAPIAARVKGLSQNNNENFYKQCTYTYTGEIPGNININNMNTLDTTCALPFETNVNFQDDVKTLYGDLYDSYYGLKCVLQTYFNSNENNYLDIIDLYNSQVYDHSTTSANINKPKLDTIINNIYKNIIDNDNNIQIPSVNTNPIILIFPKYKSGTMKKAPLSITFNNTKYNLESAAIELPNHAICGITCNGKRYIYDSNNILTEDNWHNGCLTNYYKEHQLKFESTVDNVHYKDGIQFQGFSYVIYVKADYNTQSGGKINGNGNINKLISTSFNDINEQLILLKLKKLALLK